MALELLKAPDDRESVFATQGERRGTEEVAKESNHEDRGDIGLAPGDWGHSGDVRFAGSDSALCGYKEL